MINPELKKGDRIILLHMSEENSVPDGTLGTVYSVDKVFGDIQYGVEWDNGSKLALLSDTDMWDKEERFKSKKRITEDRDKFIMNNIELFKYFNIKFLKKVAPLPMIRYATWTLLPKSAIPVALLNDFSRNARKWAVRRSKRSV